MFPLRGKMLFSVRSNIAKPDNTAFTNIANNPEGVTYVRSG
jgi:hypothetical protein